MRCPGCKQSTQKLIIAFRGSRKIEGCERCFPMRFDPHVYTNRQIWTGDEVYGREGCAELNRQFEERTVHSEPGLVFRGPKELRRPRR